MPASAEGGTPRVRGTSHTVGVIGWPVEHSLSPAIHNAAFAALGMDWIYMPLPVRPGELGTAMDGLEALGFAGANVTMPHKTEAASLVEELSDDARLLRAANTLIVTVGSVGGHNTDAPGFDRFLRHDAAFEPAGRTALLYGAGGAARACALALARGGLTSLVVAVRDVAKVDEVRAVLAGFSVQVRGVPLEQAVAHPADLVVNATPLGGRGESLPTPPLASETLVVDLLYEQAVTPLQIAAKEAGATAFGGLGLLLHQAALSFELWTGQVPPLEVMSAAALAELAERP
jgi:shikimate dehydrogenase